MIKSIMINPVELDESTAITRVFVTIDAAALSALYAKNGLDASTVNVPVGSENIPLTEAAAAGLDILYSKVVTVAEGDAS